MAKKVAKSLASLLTNGVFERGYITGFLGANSGVNGVENDPDAARKARALGRKLARDIPSETGYLLQNPVGRLTYDDEGYTLLPGPVVDQAALHGLLDKARNLGLALLEVRRVPHTR